jgi:hypothetical protein
MKSLEEQRREANFVDVVTPLTGWDEDGHLTVYRFPNDETGHGRAVQYRNAFNESLRVAMDLTRENLEIEAPDHINRRAEYEMALRVEQYRDHMAHLDYVEEKKVVGNDDPMPTDYPHDF